jgi:hypothetical protein
MKKVVDEFFQGYTPLNNLNENKIYAFKDCNGYIYKLHRIMPRIIGDKTLNYSWAILNNTCHCFTEYTSMPTAIKCMMEECNEVFEFDNIQEFNKWLNSNI